ncbi:MAG: 16S rRNA (guanine(527)-N(7))-methyltransferase RsmG [Hyphomicrobiaceae bacterium]|nr:16S rRNA (guanine(527)-N(7))-methyltransferase RsmG [Hyphomicrobiaceae bacterium]
MRQQFNTPEIFIKFFNDSHETIEKLKLYEIELKRWQPVVNLVAPSTINRIWHRHFADSAQIAEFIPQKTFHLADIGSGGGFPGLVLAIVLHYRSDFRVTLVESDGRKAAFLREITRKIEIPVEIISTRIESNVTISKLGGVDFVTARALAPLNRLLSLVFPFFSDKTRGFFLKGKDVYREIEFASRSWKFKFDLQKSRTLSEGRIVILRNLTRRPEV